VRGGGMSTSGFYDRQGREASGPTERQVAESEVVALMREIFDASDGIYGVPRMHRELRRAGCEVNEKRVRRLMRLHGIAGRCRRRRCRTTFPAPTAMSSDLVGRRFEPGPPNAAWVQDITSNRVLKFGSPPNSAIHLPGASSPELGSD
jgi:putative transposase